MIENAIFYVFCIFNIIWFINWIVYRDRSKGHFAAISEILAMFFTLQYFYGNQDVSKYHLLWAFPLAFISGVFLSSIFFLIMRGFDND
jgi:hypothetical protein